MNTKNPIHLFFFIVGLIFTFSATQVNAQKSNITFEKQYFTISKAAVTNVSDIKEDFFPSLQLIDAPQPGGENYNKKLDEIKAKIVQKQISQDHFSRRGTTADTVLIGKSFTANEPTGAPNDNSLAISNGGWIVSVVNSAIYMLNVEDEGTNNTPIEISLRAFSESLGTHNNAFDPKVIYDHEEDRFILLFLEGFNSPNSKIIVAFSQTNDPSGTWNLYSIPGNPFDNETWTDYPMMAINGGEMFLSINLLKDDSSWISGFEKTIIWQIDKMSAYNGANNLSLLLWDQNYTEGQMPVRNAIPVKHGIDFNGPNQYFLSNRNFAESNDSIFLIELTGGLGDTNAEIKVDIFQSDLAYGAPPNVNQKGSIKTLLTNDGRILGAFMENNQIHFSSTSVVEETGNAGIYHGRIKNINTDSLNISATMISDSILNYAYPNLSFSGLAPEDDQFILTFSHASSEHYAGHSVLFYNEGSYSNVTMVKPGDRTIGNNFSGNQRWGDYSGSQTKYNELGVVWTSGTYGKQPNYRGTWIAELFSPDTTFLIEQEDTTIVENPDSTMTDTSLVAIQTLRTNLVKTYPNPAKDFVTIEFDLTETAILNIALFNNEGALLRNILKQEAQPGLNQFKFATSTLPPGIYYIKINDKDKKIYTQKIIIQ